VESRDFVADLERAEDLRALDHVSKHRVLTIQVGPWGERDVNLAIAFRRIAHVSDSDCAGLMQPLLRNLGHADRRSARRLGAASPAFALRHIARLRIAELHQKTWERPMHPLAVVEATLRERDD